MKKEVKFEKKHIEWLYVLLVIGALAVGGIVNPHPGGPVYKGQEKGHFTLCGSTIVLLLQPGAAHLLPRILAEAEGGEARVAFGQWIGLAGDQP